MRCDLIALFMFISGFCLALAIAGTVVDKVAGLREEMFGPPSKQDGEL